MNNNNVLMPEAAVVARGAPALQRFLTRDIDEHARNMHGWQVRYDQVSAGAFEGELVAFRSDWMQLARDRSNQAMIKSGMAWKGAITFSIPLSADGPVYCSGHPIHEPSLLVAHGEHLPELHTPQHLDLLSVAIDDGSLGTSFLRSFVADGYDGDQEYESTSVTGNFTRRRGRRFLSFPSVFV